MRPIPILWAFAVAAALLAGGAHAQENSECLDCHEDRELTGTRNGRTVSVYVDVKRLKSAAFERRVHLLARGRCLFIAPPLVIEERDLHRGLDVVDEILGLP